MESSSVNTLVQKKENLDTSSYQSQIGLQNTKLHCGFMPRTEKNHNHTRNCFCPMTGRVYGALGVEAMRNYKKTYTKK